MNVQYPWKPKEGIGLPGAKLQVMLGTGCGSSGIVVEAADEGSVRYFKDSKIALLETAGKVKVTPY